MIFHTDAEESLFVCPECDYHLKVSAETRFSQLFDEESISYIDCPDVPTDPLKFRDQKKYFGKSLTAVAPRNFWNFNPAEPQLCNLVTIISAQCT